MCSSRNSLACSSSRGPSSLGQPLAAPPSVGGWQQQGYFLCRELEAKYQEFYLFGSGFYLNHLITFHKSFRSSYNTSLYSPMTSTEYLITYSLYILRYFFYISRGRVIIFKSFLCVHHNMHAIKKSIFHQVRKGNTVMTPS